MSARARLVASLLLATGLVAPRASAAATPATASWEGDPGTTVVLVEDARVPLVTVVLEFPVGAWSDWAWREHAEEAFNAQLFDPRGTLRSRADRLAAALNVDMGRHAATVRAECRREDLEAVLSLLGDVLSNRDLDERELRRWKRNQRLDWAASLRQPDFRLDQAAARRLYRPDDPRRRAYEEPRPIETRAARLLPVRDAIVRLPGRAIAFAGDLDRATASRLAAGLLPPVLADVPAGVEVELPPVDDEPAGDATVAMRRLNQVYFGYGRESPVWADERYPAFLVADHVLGGHFHSRLYEALRHEGGETYGAYTAGRGGPFSDAYALFTFTRAENVATTEAKLRDVLQRFHESGITGEEREAAVGYLLGRRAFARQSPAQILGRFLEERRHGVPSGFRDALAERAAATPLDDVNAFIREFFDPARFTLLRVAPE